MRATARWILVCLAGLTAIVGVVFAVNANRGQSGNNVLATSTSVASTATNVVLQLITPIGWVSPTPVATDTPVPFDTDTPGPVATATSVPATPVPATGTPLPVPTATPVPATATPLAATAT